MEQSKEEILSNLYALRAGLSIISQKSDEIKQIRLKQIREILNIGDKLREYYDLLVNAMSDSTYEYCKSNNDLNYYLKSPDFRRRYEFEQLTIKYDIRYWEPIIIENILNEKITDATKIDCRKKYINTCNDYFGSCERLEHNYAIVQWLISGGCEELLKSEYLRLSRKLFKPKDAIAKRERDLDALPVLINEVKVAENSGKPKIKQICAEMSCYYDALISEFNSILDFRDWEHLDLVIYYFETRRADSIKEALQLLDRELQTRRIEELIIPANEQLRKTLAMGFNMVRSTMETCCNKLVAQISLASAESSQLSSLASTANMGNALQTKANVTSEHLMQDVMYIRSVSEKC